MLLFALSTWLCDDTDGDREMCTLATVFVEMNSTTLEEHGRATSVLFSRVTRTYSQHCCPQPFAFSTDNDAKRAFLSDFNAEAHPMRLRYEIRDPKITVASECAKLTLQPLRE